MSQLTREGNWQKGLEIFESLGVLGVVPDTTIFNAAISACDKGGQWEKALQVRGLRSACACSRPASTLCTLRSRERVTRMRRLRWLRRARVCVRA